MPSIDSTVKAVMGVFPLGGTVHSLLEEHIKSDAINGDSMCSP